MLAAAGGVILVASTLMTADRFARADEMGESSLPSPAEQWLGTIRPDPGLQQFLDENVRAQQSRDPALRKQTIRLSVVDIPVEGAPTLAQWEGDSPVYPASVPKFVYLMAAYHWRDIGTLEFDPAFDRQLDQMIYSSSNSATQKVVARLTDTTPGPGLEGEQYAEFVEKRHAVKRWLRDLGITDLHMVHPTYNGGEISGREQQFLEDTAIEGSLPDQTGEYRNRAAMTANDSAKLLALLATDRALSPESSAEARERMRRSSRKQGYLKYRITGGAEDCGVEGVEVFAKTGTWGPIHADAGIVRAPSGHRLVVAAFLEGAPRYRGAFIARITEAVCRRLMGTKVGG